MNKAVLKYVVWYAIITIIVVIYTQHFIQPLLSYAEGWHTFYYDNSFISQTIESEGVGELIKDFFLQFFHHAWHGIAVVTFIVLCLLAFAHTLLSPCLKKVNKGYIHLLIVGLVQTIVLISLAFISKAQIGHDPMYARLNDMARNEQWDDIISLTKKNSPVNNLLYQNFLNMALAEKCELGDRLLEEPVVDIRSIYVSAIQTPEVAALLSDVYFSMGHIAQSQMYAFEANEKMDNLSPRLLQRLTITNILYGEYNVARKYLYWLSKTIYYKEWAEHYLAMLNDKAITQDKALSEKRRCIFPDNRFSGIQGIDDDLLNVARNTRGTRQCKITLQYLGSLYILAGYEKEFVEMINEFGGSQDLPKPLPACFNQYYNHLTQQ